MNTVSQRDTREVCISGANVQKRAHREQIGVITSDPARGGFALQVLGIPEQAARSVHGRSDRSGFFARRAVSMRAPESGRNRGPSVGTRWYRENCVWPAIAMEDR